MRLHLVDGTYELFRAHYSKRPGHQSPEGKNLKATVGITSSLLALLEDPAEAVTHVAVAFDNPIRSFRNDLYAGYKTEEGVDPELLAQFDDAEEATAALGVLVLSMRDFEADDGLAAAAARFSSQVDQVRILTPDKDLGQCIRGDKVVQVDRMREKLIDEAALKILRGIAPGSIPDLLALVGDTADGIPGIAGFGEKTAAALLARYPKLEQIPAHAKDWDVKVRGADVLAARLVAEVEDAFLWRKLATVREDAPVPHSLEAYRWDGVPRKKFEAWADKVGAKTLRARPKKFVG